MIVPTPQNIGRARLRRGARLLLKTVLFVGLWGAIGCAAVYPEMKTAIRLPPEGAEPDPEPSADLYFLYFDGAWIPPKDPGGRRWPGGAPDPFAKLIVDGVDVLITPIQARSREPSWPNQEKGNLRIHPNSKVFIEVWDDHAMTDLPICRARVRDLDAIREGGDNEFWCDGGARVRLHVGPAKAMLGLGLYYETRGRDGVRVTRVVQDSPAARAGLGSGDRILSIQGKLVSQMDPLEVKNAINLHARSGMELDVWFKNGNRHLISIKEGSMFPLKGDAVSLDQ